MSTLTLVIIIVFVVGYIMNWSGARADMTLGTSILAGGVFALIGFGLGKLAERMAVRKQRKMSLR